MGTSRTTRPVTGRNLKEGARGLFYASKGMFNFRVQYIQWLEQELVFSLG